MMTHARRVWRTSTNEASPSLPCMKKDSSASCPAFAASWDLSLNASDCKTDMHSYIHKPMSSALSSSSDACLTPSFCLRSLSSASC
jgi:hypothetical protein